MSDVRDCSRVGLGHGLRVGLQISNELRDIASHRGAVGDDLENVRAVVILSEYCKGVGLGNIRDGRRLCLYIPCLDSAGYLGPNSLQTSEGS